MNQTILSHADRNPLRVLETEVLEPATTTPICNNCQNPVPGFVTSEFFYTVICSEEYEDTIPFFVDGELLRKYIRRIGQPANRVLEATESIAVTSPSYPFLLKIFLERNEQGQMEVAAKLLTHVQATSEHVKTVEVETEIKCPPAVAGRYVFDFEGKTYSVYILEKENEAPVVRIPTVTEGNTEGNVEYDNENFTILYTGKDGQPYWGRTPDDRIARDFIKNLIANGVIKEDIRLIPPCSDVDIDDFIQEG
ncbi:hypothetical protein D3C76_816040 [compost metagenome]